MKISKTMLLGMFLSLLMLQACKNEKESFLNDYRDLMEKVEADHDEFDTEDWEKLNPRMEELLAEDFQRVENELNRKERKEIIRDAYKYYFYQYQDQTMSFLREAETEHFDMMLEHMDLAMETSLEVFDELEPELIEMGEEFMKLGKVWMEKMEDSELDEKMEKAAKRLEEVAKKLEEKAREIEEAADGREL